MKRLLRSEAMKLGSLRSMRILFGLTVSGWALLLLPMSRGSGDPRVFESRLTTLLVASQTVVIVVSAVVGAMTVTGEFRHRTMAPTLLVAPDRIRLLAAKAVAAAVAATGLASAITLLTLTLGATGLRSAGASAPLDAAALGRAVAIVWLSGLFSILGVAVGTLLRDQGASIGLILGWLLVVEQLASPLLGDLRRWLPGVLANKTSDFSRTMSVGDALGAAAMLVLLTEALLVGAAVTLARRDIE